MTMKKSKTLQHIAAVAVVLLTLSLVFMMPVGADDITTEAALGAVVSGEISLGGNIELANPWTVPTGVHTLNLNGYNITGGSSTQALINVVNEHPGLNITDFSENTHNGIFSNGHGIIVANGTLTVKSGVIIEGKEWYGLWIVGSAEDVADYSVVNLESGSIVRGGGMGIQIDESNGAKEIYSEVYTSTGTGTAVTTGYGIELTVPETVNSMP